MKNAATVLGAAAAGLVSVGARERLRRMAQPALAAPQIDWTPRLPSISLREAVQGARAVIPIENAMDGNVSPLELIALAGFAGEPAVKNIFEIGTFNGFTSLTFALNSAPDARVYTLDLPPEGDRETGLAVAGGDKKYIAQTEKGGYFRQGRHPEESKVTQLYGDSARFDYAPYLNRMDLVFVDGAHSYDYVRSDTEIARRLLRNGHGVIVWHDYNTWWPGVIQFLEESADRAEFSPLRHIAGTSIVFLRT